MSKKSIINEWYINLIVCVCYHVSGNDFAHKVCDPSSNKSMLGNIYNFFLQVKFHKKARRAPIMYTGSVQQNTKIKC